MKAVEDMGTTERVVDEYVMWLKSWGASERTIEVRRTLARSRLDAWGLDGITTANLAEFLARPNLKSQWSRSTYHAHLNDFCSWLTAAGYLTENPMENVRKPKRPKSQPRPLTEREIERVLSVAEGRVRDWLLLALYLGLRAHEVAKIRGEDVSERGVYVYGKGGVPATLPCHPEIWEMAQRYPRQGYWFPGKEDGHMRGQQVSLTVGRFFDALGIEGSIHRMRHSFGTRLLRSGVHIRRVQKLMRHASLETTATYTAVDEDELRDAILMLPGVPSSTDLESA